MRNLIPVLVCFLIIAGCNKQSSITQHQEKDSPKLIHPQNSVSSPGIGTNEIAGVNWADARDNFVDGWVIPSGLTASDDYSTVQTKTSNIIGDFQAHMGANTVRLPINSPSVAESWWNAYSGAIDKSLDMGMKVVLAYWEADSSKDGRVDNMADFWSMWDQVVNDYGSDSDVYFEVINEPHGYSLTELTSLYEDWLNRYSSIPKGRILLGGSGYSENVSDIGDDSRFDGCLLSQHLYAWWGNYTDPVAWEDELQGRIGSYSSRTVLTEFGAPMTTGKDYSGAVDGDAEIAYIQGITNMVRNNKIASIYWPGLRDGDTYTIQERSGSGSNISLSTTNTSGLTRIKFGWGVGGTFDPDSYYKIINRNSGKALDVDDSSTQDGTELVQWTDNGSNSQQWRVVDIGDEHYKIINRKSGSAVDVNGASSSNGANIIQWPWNEGNNQRWTIEDVGSGYYRITNLNSGQVIDVNQGSTSNGAQVIQWPWNSGNNQQWEIIEL